MKKQDKKAVSKDKEMKDFLEKKRAESMIGQKRVKKEALQQAYAGRL